VGEIVMPDYDGKFLVYFPRLSGRNERLKTVVRAVSRLSETLGTDIELSQRRDVLSVWVYFKNSRKEKIRLYSDWGKNWSEDDVFHTIENKLYGLFLHHEHAVSPVIIER
jgi:hypothetical protein